MEARAINRYIGSSPRKMRMIIDLIRGKTVEEALHTLHFSTKHASKVAEKVLRSAVSNLQNKDDAGRLEPEEIIVKEAFVDPGMTMKRISPAPMGRGYRIRKRSNHVTIVVAAKEDRSTPARKAKGAEKKEETKHTVKPAAKATAKPEAKAAAKPAKKKQAPAEAK